MNKDSALYVRADKGLLERLKRIAAKVDRPASQIVREAVKRELDTLDKKTRLAAKSLEI